MLVLLAAATLLLLYRIAELVLIAFVSALLAVYLARLMELFGDVVRTPRGVALGLAIALTLAALAGVGVLLAPAVAQQTQDLIQAFPRYLTELDRVIRGWGERYPVLRRAGIASADRGLVTAALTEFADFVRRGIIPYATATGKMVIDTVAVVVMAVYLAHSPRRYHDGVVALVPPRFRSLARDILADLGATLRAWVMAQLLGMVVLAALTGIGLWLLDVPYWLAFSIFTGVVVLVPFFGTLVSTVLPALLVLGDRGLLPALAVASVGVVVHLLEANLVAPLIMHRQVRLPPVLTIMSVLVMAKLGGLVGLLVAVPTLATVMVLARHILLFRVYGERRDAPSPAVAPAVPAS